MTDAAKRESFINWFNGLKPQERVDVWYECEAMTRDEVEGELGRLREVVRSADAMRDCSKSLLDENPSAHWEPLESALVAFDAARGKVKL